MKLGKLILEYRQQMGISQREFARRCGLSNTYIHYLENEINAKDKRTIVPTLEQYKKFASGMNMTVQELFEKLDEDSPVSLHIEESASSRKDEPLEPKDENIRLLIRGLNKLTPEQIEQATNVFKAMFEITNPDLFKEGDDNK